MFDFDQVQIASFATKWFAALTRSRVTDLSTSSNKIPPIQELATSPLLLMLCLIVNHRLFPQIVQISTKKD